MVASESRGTRPRTSFESWVDTSQLPGPVSPSGQRCSPSSGAAVETANMLPKSPQRPAPPARAMAVLELPSASAWTGRVSGHPFDVPLTGWDAPESRCSHFPVQSKSIPRRVEKTAVSYSIPLTSPFPLHTEHLSGPKGKTPRTGRRGEQRPSRRRRCEALDKPADAGKADRLIAPDAT